MRKDLIITNAMSIAYFAAKENWADHINLSISDYGIQLEFFFNLHDEKVKSIHKMIKKSTNFTPKYENPKFYDSNFEVLRLKWEF